MRSLPSCTASRASRTWACSASSASRTSTSLSIASAPRVTRSTSPTCRTRFRPPSAATPSARCCRASSASTWCCATRRRTATRRKPSPTSACSRPPASASRWRSSASIETTDGASEIYREANQRYVAVKYSVRGRDLGSTVEEAMAKVNRQVKLPPGYKYDWAGEYESQKRSEARLAVIVPITIFLIFLILYSAFGSAKWACLNLMNLFIAPIGGLFALLVHRHALQRLLGHRLPGPVRRFGADRRHHGRVHQPVARPRAFDRRGRRRRRRPPACGRS